MAYLVNFTKLAIMAMFGSVNHRLSSIHVDVPAFRRAAPQLAVGMRHEFRAMPKCAQAVDRQQNSVVRTQRPRCHVTRGMR